MQPTKDALVSMPGCVSEEKNVQCQNDFEDQAQMHKFCTEITFINIAYFTHRLWSFSFKADFPNYW